MKKSTRIAAALLAAAAIGLSAGCKSSLPSMDDLAGLAQELEDEINTETSRLQQEFSDDSNSSSSSTSSGSTSSSSTSSSSTSSSSGTSSSGTSSSGTSSGSASSAASVSADYILPDSNVRYLSKSELRSLSDYELMLARNEIYARHGRRFADSTLQLYFNQKSWYHGTVDPEDFSDSVFNKYERANIDTIVAVEQSRK